MPRPTSTVGLALLLVAGCRCDEPPPEWPVRSAGGTVRVVEAAAPSGGLAATAATSDLSVPPREGDIGWWPDLALDASARPHLSYTDAFNGEVHYAEWTGEGFAITRVDTYGAVGKYTAIALDAEGRPHLVYYNQDERRLRYAVRVGAQHYDPKDRRRPYKGLKDWLYEIVDEGPEVGMAARLLVAPDGSVHLVYYRADETLMHAMRPPTAPGVHARWRLRKIDTKAGGSHSIVLGFVRADDGTLHLSYAHWTVFDSELRYATLAPGAEAWHTEAVTKEYSAGWKSDLVLLGDGRPFIVYLALEKRRLYGAVKTKEGWRRFPLVGAANTMHLEATDRCALIVAYEHLPGVGLENARLQLLTRPDCDGDLSRGWTVETVEGGEMSSYLSLDVAGETPMVALYDGGIRGVKLWSKEPLPPPQAPTRTEDPPPAEGEGDR